MRIRGLHVPEHAYHTLGRPIDSSDLGMSPDSCDSYS
jgi:hypothetical protein